MQPLSRRSALRGGTAATHRSSEIIKTPAVSLAGLAVKRRLSEKLSEDWKIADVHQRMMLSLFESAERCMRGGRS